MGENRKLFEKNTNCDIYWMFSFTHVPFIGVLAYVSFAMCIYCCEGLSG